MTDLDSMIAVVVAAAGGKIVGRVRLQKVFYLLEQMGLGQNLPYEYHHYGPYSSELSEAVVDAVAFGFVEERLERRSDGVGYSVYEAVGATPVYVGAIEFDDLRSVLDRMQECSSTVLELAATIHWLWVVEQVEDWRSELRRRKGVKAEGGRVESAISLLHALGFGEHLLPS